jgi:DNA-binding beta-propeller fold protein YncE
MEIRTKRAIGVGVAIGAVLGVALVSGPLRSVATPEVNTAAREAPQFAPDPDWPKIPNGWALGQVSSAAADADDNIWVLQRPRTIRPDQKTGPPVMEFDAAGNYVRGWGGPGAGYDWPQTEHGIYVDYKGYVWIGGSGNDDQILKFTKEGKFVMQLGHGGKKKSNQDTANFWKPADVFVYPKTNELFVADGYGNKRIIVFDADTGAFKRMWGAFGKPPQDDSPAAAEAEGRQSHEERLARIPAKDLPSSDLGPPQFSTVHGVKVSNDGLVYVSDRGGKRVQVFTVDGKFVSQTFVDRWCEAIGQGCGNGQTVASTAFSADPEQRFLYVASRSPARIWVFERKTMERLYAFGRPGVAPGEFYVLHHMTTDTRGNLYTSEVEDGHRVQRFVFKGLAPIPGK